MGRDILPSLLGDTDRGISAFRSGLRDGGQVAGETADRPAAEMNGENDR
jgi:hypothetical protein